MRLEGITGDGCLINELADGKPGNGNGLPRRMKRICCLAMRQGQAHVAAVGAAECLAGTLRWWQPCLARRRAVLAYGAIVVKQPPALAALPAFAMERKDDKCIEYG